MLDKPNDNPAAGRQRQRFYGKYRATVQNNVDPLMMGRITAFVPELLQGIMTGWATPCAPVGGLKSGFFAVPPPGSGVWIEFEAGDISRPIWVGGFWGAPEMPTQPPSPASPLPTEKIWRSETGLTVAMDDLMQSVTICDGLGVNKVKVDVKTGTVTLSGMARVVLDAPIVQEGSGQAFHPSVLGDQLLLYLQQLVMAFNTHVHPGELALGFMPVTPAPPVMPMPPPSPSLVSTKVFLE
ncbi:MAG: hypothetical protein IOC52_10450 [Methylobacterium sp.]|jgi:hypothetical protein|nr:hypothetical protein [Methylobacterium sp.]